MTPSEITRGFLTAQLANAQRTHDHAQQLIAEAQAQLARAVANVADKNLSLPQMHAAHHVLCTDSLKHAEHYAAHAAAELTAANARIEAHDKAQAALPVIPPKDGDLGTNTGLAAASNGDLSTLN